MNRLLLGLLVLTNITGASIRDFDFRNFAYPFVESEFVSVPDHLRWMALTGTSVISLRDGRYTFPCEDSPCPLLTLDKPAFGNINGLPDTSALVSVTYHTGGTATWRYLYVFALRSGKPHAIAWLEAGSRARMGLRSAAVDGGALVLIVEDPDKRMGDCCSTGTITYRYRWLNGSFQRIGTPLRADDPQ
jgi:hypothetical protein